MTKGRLEAYSDAVIAILITIMVLELKVPHGEDLEALGPSMPGLLNYVLSFIYLGIYWNNHHHMLQAAERINGGILWANQHLLFWLSLVPFTTAYMSENHLAPLPTAVYGLNLVLAAVGYTILQSRIIAHHGPESRIAAAIGSDAKGKLSMLFYLLGIGLAFVSTLASLVLYIAVALMWLVPDWRIESRLAAEGKE